MPMTGWMVAGVVSAAVLGAVPMQQTSEPEPASPAGAYFLTAQPEPAIPDSASPASGSPDSDSPDSGNPTSPNSASGNHDFDRLASASPATGGPAAPWSLEFLAQQAISDRQWGTALELLRRMEQVHEGDERKVRAIQEQIRFVEHQAHLGEAGINPMAPEHRTPVPPPVPGQVTVFANVRDVGNFEYDPETGGNIPADILAISGTPIRVRGFMIPLDQAANITTFALVPDLFACCFGQPPRIQHMIVVNTPRGKAVSYYPEEIVVEGTLKVEEKREEGFIISLFELTASSVRPAGR